MARWSRRRHVATVGRGAKYHLKVATKSASIKAYLDNGATPFIDAADRPVRRWSLVFSGTTRSQDIRLS
ncbi:hypothetical protein GCM10022222_69750 [Amycolatopsis ultiminotia]|uniref:Transposase n=1 Tax=Amycolatopsis ultiminotia TaxID=543629 RepID=A0ABP6XZY7_9PSEU